MTNYDELRRLEEAGTRGEWAWDGCSIVIHDWSPHDPEHEYQRDDYGQHPDVLTTGSTYGCYDGCKAEEFLWAREEDARLAVAARNALPALLEEVEELRAWKAEAMTVLGELRFVDFSLVGEDDESCRCALCLGPNWQCEPGCRISALLEEP